MPRLPYQSSAQNLVFLVDVSSSMNKPGRLPLFQETMARLAGTSGQKITSAW